MGDLAWWGFLGAVVAASWAGDRLLRSSVQPENKYYVAENVGRISSVGRYLVAAIVGFSIFLGTFYLLGFAELLSGRRLVVSALAFATCLGLLGGLIFALWRAPPGANPGPDTLANGTARSAQGFVKRARFVPSRVLLLATVLTYGAVGAMLVFGFPRGYEPLAYHLPIGVEVFQSGSLKPWDGAYVHTFPANMSLFTGFFLQVFPERAASALGLPFLALLILAIYAISRVVGADRNASVIAALGVATVPMVAFSSLELGADVAGAAFLGIALWLILAGIRVTPYWALLSGLSAGLAYGFKSLHLVGIGFLGLVIVYGGIVGWRQRTGSGIVSVLVGPAGLFALGVFSTSGFWLIRNYVEFGNPLYPIHFPGFDWLGWSLAPDIDYTLRDETQFEFVRAPWEWLVYPWVEWHFIGQNFKHSAGLGAFFAAMVPAALFVHAIRGARDLRAVLRKGTLRAYETDRLVLLLGGTGILAVWWFLNDRQPRYFMGALVFIFPLVAFMLSSLRGRWRRFADVIAISCAGVMLTLILLSQGAEFASRYLVSKQFERWKYYEYPKEIDNLPAGSRVANLPTLQADVSTRPAHYRLSGAGLRNRVLPSTSAVRLFAQIEEMPDDGSTSGSDINSTRTIFKGSYGALIRGGVTHLFVVGEHEFQLEGCGDLKEVGKLSHNPSNGFPLKAIAYLIEVIRC